ncbi:MAG: hypothetical protein O6922_02475 [Chloroflexi bacterium]|nr:hypothetical protein [Chloroflexota bacterium]
MRRRDFAVGLAVRTLRTVDRVLAVAVRGAESTEERTAETSARASSWRERH